MDKAFWKIYFTFWQALFGGIMIVYLVMLIIGTLNLFFLPIFSVVIFVGILMAAAWVGIIYWDSKMDERIKAEWLDKP